MSDKSSSPAQRPAGDQGPGVHALGLGGQRDGLVRVPPDYHPDKPVPMMVLLHGAGSDARTVSSAFEQVTDAAGVLLLAPDSRGRTWDAILDEAGPDVAFLQSAVEKVFGEFAVQPDGVALAGFSDGASYALSVGLANGELFRHILAFSPGFVMPLGQNGQPRVFISHGTADSVLPINRCSRMIHPQLLRAGYEVFYREFSGGHTMPPKIVNEAVDWWLDDRSAVAPPPSP